MYHLFALFLGVAYYFVSILGFNFLGEVVGPIFNHYQPNPDSVLMPVAINIVIAFFGSLVPAATFIVVVHFVLAPKTKLFLFSSTLAFVFLSVMVILTSFNGNNFLGLNYIYNLSGKVIGGVIVLWVISIIYLNKKPNKALFRTA